MLQLRALQSAAAAWNPAQHVDMCGIAHFVVPSPGISARPGGSQAQRMPHMKVPEVPCVTLTWPGACCCPKPLVELHHLAAGLLPSLYLHQQSLWEVKPELPCQLHLLAPCELAASAAWG